MSRNLASLSFAASIFAGTALADVPQVAIDVAPVHSIVARVMQGVGTPSLIVAPGASPHEYRLRPSEAAALQNADLVFWVSPDLTPWLEDAIDTLAAQAKVVELLDSDGTTKLEMREGASFDAHDHGHDEKAHEDHTEEGEGEDHAEHEKHDDHANHDDHGEYDPHAWLSPQNGSTWMNAVAAALSAVDPDNAGAYYANAATAQQELAALSTEIDGILDPVRGGKFIVLHDAYQYFETAFDFPAAGAISLSDAADPGPARISEIQARVADQGIVCVLSEPQFNEGIVTAVMDGTQANTGVLDPLGSDLEPGADLYRQLLRNLATTLADCL